MAHGWDSYFNDIPTLSSNPRTLRSASAESEGTLSQSIENFIGHNEFSNTEASHEDLGTISNYLPNPSTENSTTDCVYQQYCRETPWQADGEQMAKDYLPRCGNSDISDFTTDAISSESFPSSFATDLQGLKQDCEMLTTSFLESCSDVSSCSDADVGETRPSCKFMKSNSLPKCETDVTTKSSSLEWLFTPTGNLTFPPENDVILPSSSNVKSKENIVECAQDQMKCPAKTVKSYIDHNRSSTTNMVPTTESETVEASNDLFDCQDQEQRLLKGDLTQGKCTSNSTDLRWKDQDKSEVLKERNETHGQDKNTESVCQEKEIQSNTLPSSDPCDIRGSQSKDTTCELREYTRMMDCESQDGGFWLELSDHQSIETVGQNSICSNPTMMNIENFNEVNDKNKKSVGRHSESYIQSNSPITDVNSCLEKDWASAKRANTASSPNSDCSVTAITSDNISVNTKKLKKVSKSSLQPDCSSTDTNPLKETESGSLEEKNSSSSIVPDCAGSTSVISSDNNKQHVANHLDSCLQIDCSSIHTNSGSEMELTSPPEKTNTTFSLDHSDPSATGLGLSLDINDKNEQGVTPHLEPNSQPGNSSTDSSCPEMGNMDTTSSPCPQQSHESPVALSENVVENLRESFEELDTSKKLWEAGVLYGEPLSSEDSSCDSDEEKLAPSQCKETSMARSNSNGTNHSGHAPPLKPSIQLIKRLQPVVIMKITESKNGTNNLYHCASCRHVATNVDHLIEHHHCCHLVHSFQFCKTCNLYLLNKEEAEKHACSVTKEGLQLPSDPSSMKKRKRHGHHRCYKCGLFFSKLIHYIQHMRTHTGKTPYMCKECGTYFAQNGSLQRHKRIPGRCKRTKLKSATTISNTVISVTKTVPKKDLLQMSNINLSDCYVKLFDISKANICSFCGKGFSTTEKAKKHYYNVHKGRSFATSSSPSATKFSGEKLENVEEETSKYKCPLCPRLFKYSYNRARHLRDCVRDATYGGKAKIGSKYRCPLCTVTFTLPSNRYRHIKTSCLKECLNRLSKERANSKQNVEKKPSKETEPQKQSKDDEQRKQSKENDQKRQEPPTTPAPKNIPHYKCNLCPAVFCHASGKYRHMKKHEVYRLTGKMFRYRNSVFSTKSKLTTFSGTKTEQCEDELKSTEAKTNSSLSCHFCGKCFSTSQSLEEHERNHKGERPYRCLDCGKGFKKRSYLMGHKIVHQRRIQCTVCRKILPNIGELIQHRTSHQKKGKLQCPDCPLQFQYPAYLLRHLDTHKNRDNQALFLEEALPIKSQQTLETEKEQSGPKNLQCSLCEEVFTDAQVLRKHCLSHISVYSSRQCPFCKRNFTSRRYLLRHMVRHTGDKAFSCTNCGKQFYRDLYLKLHLEKCLPEKDSHLVPLESDKDKTWRAYHCTHCPRTFSKKDRLISHHRGHNLNTLLLCTGCKQYYGLRKLHQHQRNCKGISEAKTVPVAQSEDFSTATSEKCQTVYKIPLKSNVAKMLQLKCPHCTQTFRFRSVLLRHIVSHTGVQPYACMHCGHRFGSQTMCLKHEAFCDGVYKEVQPKVKSDAEKKLSNMPNLRDSAQKPKAEGEAEYKCKFCTKTFMKSRNLRRHILTHNDAKPYCCKFCDSGFTRYDYLKVHQVHCKGRRSRLEVCIPKISLDDVGKGWQNRFAYQPVHQQDTFQCDVCSRSFSTQSKLSRHVTMFHTVKLFKCERCGSSFSHEKSLKKHCKMRKCRNASKETNSSSLPSETHSPPENVTKPLHEVGSRVLQRIQPHFNKKHKYVCSYCPRTFRNSWQLRVHTRLHTGEKPYACDYCGLRFIRKDYVQRHYPKCTRKQDQSKGLCESGGFFSEVALENHKSCPLKQKLSAAGQQNTSQSPPKGFSCAYCSSRFLLFSQLQEHFLNAHKLETMAPPVATAPLQHHLSNIPTIREIKEEPMDESCDEQLPNGPNLICKLDKTLDDERSKSLICSVCNMSFASKAGLTGHLRVHQMEHPFSCKTCNKGFWNKSLLRNHNRKCRFAHISAGGIPQPLQVPLKAEIDLALTDSVLLFSESSKTTGTGVLQTNFSCKDDLMDESPQNSEENRVQSSSRREKYQCSECDMSFTDGLMLISHLEDHGRRDQEKKRNTCPKCGRLCSSQGHLEKHMNLHGINKKISCPDCPKMVYTLTDLEVHRSCHDPNRPYACKLCNHRFWTRPSLCNHYSEDHPNDVFTCHFCNKAYSVKKSLARHYKKWHQKEQKDLLPSEQEKGTTDQQSGSQVSTTGESDEDESNRTEDSDSDSAPYFPCHVCGKTFPTSESLEDHQRCHLGEKPHECAECGKCFFQASQLQQHQRMHKSEFQCQACGRGFVTLFALRKHKHTHGKSRPYRCPKCHLSFTGPLPLSEHMSTHSEENFPCDICNRMFLSKSSRAEHRKSHSHDHPLSLISSEDHEKSATLLESSSVSTKELKYRCGVCNERFKDPEELSEHGCIAAKERLYSCSDCHKHFLHASHLKKHRTTHHLSCSTSEYLCNQCNNSFSSAQHFLDHLKSHDVIDSTAEVKGKPQGLSRVFICPVCYRCFLSATELTGHFPTHTNSIFKCKICQMAFTSGSQLEEHERCHLTSGTDFKFIVCDQRILGNDAFRQQNCTRQQDAKVETGKLKPSVKASPASQAAGEEEEIDVTGEDVYICPVCAMQFSSKSVLLEHQNKQHGPRANPFKCQLCEKTFALKRYLREHERRHRQKLDAQKNAEVTEKKFNCTQCCSEFKTAKELSLHMRKHAEKDVGEYRCDMCYKSFNQWSLLKQHQESHVGQVVYECTECDKAFAFPHLLEQHQLTHAGSSQ